MICHLVAYACYGLTSSDALLSQVPMWDSVKGLQGGMKDLQAEVKATVKDLAGITHQQV